MTYAGAGVSISAGNELVDRIKALVKSTARPGASSDLGGFGGMFDLAEAGYKEVPLLVTGMMVWEPNYKLPRLSTNTIQSASILWR